MKKKYIIMLAVCVALSACSPKVSGEKIEEKDISEYEAEDNSDEEPKFAKVGKKAPDITVTKFDGTEAKLSEYYGKPIIIEFWATWCGYCKKELPALEMLKENYGEEINILALNCGDTAEDAEDFWNESDYTFEAAMVGTEDSYRYGTDSIPVTVIIDADGVVRFFEAGSADAETMYSEYFVPVFDELLGK